MTIPVFCLFCQVFQWNTVVIILAAILGMVAISVWMLRNYYRFVHVVHFLGIWFLFLILTTTTVWQAYREEQVLHETWKSMLFAMTNSFAGTTEMMGHAKISSETSSDDPLYCRIRDLHAQWCQNIPLIARIYTLRLRDDQADAVSWVVCCEADVNRNHRIEKPEEAGKELYQPSDVWLEIYRKGFDGHIALDEVESEEVRSMNIHSTLSGNFITVIAPLRDPENSEFVEAILGIDFRTDYHDQVLYQIRQTSSQSLILLFVLYLGSIFLIVFLHRTVGRLTQTNRELANAQKITETAAKAKNDFLVNMNHDIRTPMNVIIGFTDILMHRVLQYGCVQEWEESHGIVEIIQKNSHDLLTIINDFIDFSQIEANLLQIESVPLSIKAIIDEIERTAIPIVAEKKLQFAVKCKEPIPELILGDPARLRQILINLTDNAIKFTSKGKIEIRCEAFQDPVSAMDSLPHKIKIDGHSSSTAATILKISVYDTGIGISPEQMEYLFQPFAVDHSLTREFGGTGLGLSIVNRLAQLMDGNITVKSEPNVGSIFTLTLHVYLPSKQESDIILRQNRLKESAGDSLSESNLEVRKVSETSASKQGSEHLSEPQPLENVRILLVEDMHINQLVISTQLRNAGAKVEIAGNGELGIQKITQDMDNGLFFDVVLMDMQMPVKDGYAATAQLRSQGYDRPIIAVTAHALTGDREKTIAAGCDDYISKPVDRKILINTIKKYLKSKK